ncbi:acylase, partial [Streptomyces sp. NPDC002033]
MLRSTGPPPPAPAIRAAAASARVTASASEASSPRRSAPRSQSVGAGRGPRATWQGGRRFWQSQQTVPGVLNVSGGSLLGTPVV